MPLPREDRIYLAYKNRLTAKKREASSDFAPTNFYAILEVAKLFRISFLEVQRIVRKNKHS